jgi:hypothetical protein
MSMPTPHTCPGDGCTEQIPVNRLMCKDDWYRVPKPVRDAVWQTWDSGRGAGSQEHRAAILAAIGACNRARAEEGAGVASSTGARGPGS